MQASDDLGKSDKKLKVKVSRPEAKDTIKWLDLTLTYGNKHVEGIKVQLKGEQIRKILSAIIIKLGD